MRRLMGAVTLSYALMFGGVVALFLRVGFPYHRMTMLLFFLASLAPLVLAARKRSRLLRVGRRKLKRRVRPYWVHAVVALFLLLTMYVVGVLAPDDDLALLHMRGDQQREMIDADFGALKIIRANLRDALTAASESPLRDADVSKLSADDRAVMRRFWAEVLTSGVELDTLMLRYRAFYLIDHVSRPKLHSEAFLLAYGAFVTQLRSLYELVSVADGRLFLETLMDEAVPGLGIPEDSFTAAKAKLVHPDSFLRLTAGYAYGSGLLDELLKPHESLWNAIEKDYVWLMKEMGRNPLQLIDRPLDVMERRISRIFAPLQKRIAVQMSFLRMSDRPYRINGDLLVRARKQCQPGDILLERRSWHATNAGIPGFWPHSALYIGTPGERRVAFGADADSRLEVLVPGIKSKLASVDTDGRPFAVIESLRDGVILNSFKDSANADYLAILRPRADAEERFKAIATAMTHLGKPYDYEFDFATDGAMVCSELISKSYAEVSGVDLSPGVFSGRLLLPTNLIAQKYAMEAGKENQQLDFVAFVDSSNSREVAWLSDENSFRESWKRPKWDVLTD